MSVTVLGSACCCEATGVPCLACNQAYNNPPSAVSLAHTIQRGFSFSFNSGFVTIPCPTQYDFVAACPQVTLPLNQCGWAASYPNIQQATILASGFVGSIEVTYVLGWYQAECSWSSVSGSWLGKINIGLQGFKTGLPFIPANSVLPFSELLTTSLPKACTPPINPFGTYTNGVLACNGSSSLLAHILVVS